MKIYREVLIESVEQAEALPEDTPVLIKVDGEAFGLEFARDLLPEHMTPVHHARHYALVPIEAEGVRSEFTGIGFATERLAGGPFTAYYVHEREA